MSLSFQVKVRVVPCWVRRAPGADQAKGGAPTGGVVPDEVQDSQPPDSDDPLELSNDSLGDFPERNAEDRIDLSAGDNADATSQGHSGCARASEAGLGRHEEASVDEDNPDQTLDEDN